MVNDVAQVRLEKANLVAHGTGGVNDEGDICLGVRLLGIAGDGVYVERLVVLGG